MIEDPFQLYSIVGIAGTLLTAIILITTRLVGDKPLAKLIEGYKKNPKFSELQFKIIEETKIVGKINDFNIELVPTLKQEGGMKFILTIDLSRKPYFNNDLNLRYAFSNQKFVQDRTKVIVTSWEPKILNYGNFDKVLQELQLLLDKIENKSSYNKSS